MVETHHHHRPTLKQQNKPFKSRHATKSSLKDAAKANVDCRIARTSPKSASTSAQNRLRRRNQAKQVQSLKRQALISATRVFTGVDGAPRIVSVIPLSEDVNVGNVVRTLAESLDVPTHDFPETGVWKIRAERFKTSLQFINTRYKSFYEALDACKVADYVIFALSATVEVDPWGDTLLRTLQAQGLPSVVTIVAKDPALDPKLRLEVQKSLLSFIQYFVPTQTRIFDLSSSSDSLNAVRALSEGKPDDVRWREGRMWILAEKVEWEENETMILTGVVRGAPLSAHRLFHLPNYGDFQLSKVVSAPLHRHAKSRNVTDMEVEPTVLAEPHSSDIDSLVSRNNPDELANEQTWPTEEEMQGNYLSTTDDAHVMPDATMGTTPKRVRRIPKGMSEYQASWIVDEDEDGDEGDGDHDGDEGDSEEGSVEEMQDEQIEMQSMHVDEGMELESRQDAAFQDMDMEEENKQLERWRNREREERDDHAFPDEIDTPKDIPARTRFQRYRGLRSARTTPWDPYENLPRDYARIFQFEDYKRTGRAVRRRIEQETAAVEIGTRVAIYVKGVPESAKILQHSVSPVVIFGLMQHEHRVSVLNFTLQRNTEYDGSVRSKDPLVLCVGPRRLRVNPIYSQHTRGGGKGTNHVHKFERYLRPGLTSVATIYGPVVFGKQPCVVLRETSDPQCPQLVATGSFLNPDTTRVIAKRVILTGHPFKVHKKTVTVRYMFFHPDDIQYFKPVTLHTKHGRTGHIRESLGTHGYFKAHFDGLVNQMDTICMSLYKRVFPRWSQLLRLEESDRKPLWGAMEE